MSEQNKEKQYITAIIGKTGLSQEEIIELGEEKIRELKGLISMGGALFMISKELKIDIPDNNQFKELETKKITIKDLTTNMKNLTLIGSISEIGEMRSFTKKTGEEGRVVNFKLQDNTGIIRIVLWDELTDIINKTEFQVNAQVKITSGYTKHSDYWDKLEVILSDWSTITFEEGSD